MTSYRRIYIPGATWFFTVNLARRKSSKLLVEVIAVLLQAFAPVRQRQPFRMDAEVILLDHLHCI